MLSHALSPPAGAGWLRSRWIDGALIAGPALLGAAAGVLAARAPQTAAPLLVAVVLLALARVHAAGGPSRAQIVAALAGAALLGAAWAGFGPGAAIVVALAWRWAAIAGGAASVARLYDARAAGKGVDAPGLAQAQFWLLPLWGAAHHAAGAPISLFTLTLPALGAPHGLAASVAVLAGIIALTGLGLWAVRRLAEWRLGEVAGPHTLYVCVCQAMFALGFLVSPDLGAGLIGLEIWRGSQELALARLRRQPSFTAVP